MTIHARQHGLNGTDHLPGTTPGAGEHTLPATSDAGALAEVTAEAEDAAPSSGGKLVRRAANGQVKVPTSGQGADEAYSRMQVDALLASGVWKSPVHSSVADHTAATVGNGSTGGPALEVGDVVINLTDAKLYTVTSVAGGSTGELVTWSAGAVPTTPEVRVDRLADTTRVYDTDSGAWIDQGSSSHTRQHAMSSTADHTAGNWTLFHSNGSGEVVEVPLGAEGAPLLGGGASAAPAFGSLLLAPSVASAAGETPVDSDVSSWADETLGIVIGTTGRVFGAFKNASDVYYVELTAV